MVSRLHVIYRRWAENPEPDSLTRWLLGAVHSVSALGREAVRDRLHVRAATLAYWTLVAVVPLLIVALALLGPLGLVEETQELVRNLLYSSMLAGSVSEVGDFFDQQLSSVKLETLGVIGFVAVLFTASRIYFSVESVYNDIFGVRVRRGFLLRFALFYAVVTLGPVLLSLGFIATGKLGETLPAGLVGAMLPIALTTLAFVLAIRLLPQVEVRWRSALIGGVASAVVFELAKTGFGAYTELLGAGSAVARLYGSLGLLPVFLVWLYTLWLIALVGVEAAYVAENSGRLLPLERQRLLRQERDQRTVDDLFCLQVLVVVADRYLARSGAVSGSYVASVLGCSSKLVARAVEVLHSVGVVAPTEDHKTIPAMPPDQIRANEVLHACRRIVAPSVPEASLEHRLERRVRAALDRSLDVSLADLVADLLRAEGELSVVEGEAGA